MDAPPLSLRPLRAGDPLYVERPDEERLLRRAVDLGLNIAVVGEAGTGKTTLLREVLSTIEDQRRIVWVDGNGSSVSEFADRIAEGFGWRRPLYRLEPREEFEPHGVLDAMMERVPIEPDPDRLDRDRLSFLARAIADAPNSLRTGTLEDRWICVVDGPSVGAFEEMFGRYRERLWDMPVQWVVVTRMMSSFGSASLFFEAEVHIAELPVDLAAKLVRLRLHASGVVSRPRVDRLSTTIANQVPTRPRDLVSATRNAVLNDDESGEERFKVQAQLIERAAKLGRSHAMVMAELISLGGAHAGDDELQKRLGYSRPRLVQLLHDLESAFLAERRLEGRRVRFVPAERVR